MRFYEEKQGKIEYEEDEMTFSLLATIRKDPTLYQQAMSSPEHVQWQNAIDEDLNAMVKNEVWTMVDYPVSRKEVGKINVIDSKWVFKTKTDHDGNKTYKARLVIRGFKNFRKYKLTYAPVSRLALIRAVLAAANKFDWELCQMDVKTAFLNGVLHQDIYIKIPDGVKVSNRIRKTQICKLKKALYGLRISQKKMEHQIHRRSTKTWFKKYRKRTLSIYMVKTRQNGFHCSICG